MKYAHLINACHTPQERAELGIIFAHAGVGLALLMTREKTLSPEVRETLANETGHYLDATRALEALVIGRPK